MSYRPKGHHFLGCSAFVMVREDLAAFEHELREAFPRIRFILDTASLKLERAALAKSDGGVEKRSWQIPYIDGFTVASSSDLREAWVEPEGWLPTWGIFPPSFPMVQNVPALGFNLALPYFASDRQSGAFSEPPRRVCDDEIIKGREAAWSGSYYDNKPEQKKFLLAVRRIFFRLTTNQYVAVDLASGAITARSDKGGSFRFGWRALAWSASHRNNFLCHRMKPFDWDPALNTAPRTIEMAAKLPKF